MADRTSNYRQIRLLLMPSMAGQVRTAWDLSTITVVKGIPHHRAIDEGLMAWPMPSSPEEVIQAVCMVADVLDGRWHLDARQ